MVFNSSFGDQGKAFEIASELLADQDILSPTKNEAKLVFRNAERRLRDVGNLTPDQMDEVLGEVSSRIEGNIVTNKSDFQMAGDLNPELHAKTRASFNDWSSQSRMHLYDQYDREYKASQKAANVAQWDDQFGTLADLIDGDFNELGEALPEYLDETKKRMQEAGFDAGTIEKNLKKYEKDAVEIAFHTLNRQDPGAAEQFASDNADLFGAKVVGLKNQARNARARMESAMRKAEIEQAKAGFRGLNADQIAEKEQEAGPIGEAARETSRKLQQDPYKLIEDVAAPLNVSDPTSLQERMAQADAAEEEYSTPNRPVEMPYLSKDNVKSFKERLARSPRHAQEVMDFLTSGDSNQIDKLSRSFGDDPIRHAMKVYQHDKALGMKIIEGINSLNKPKESEKDLAKTTIFSDPASNRAAIRAMSNLSKVDPDNYEKAVNMQDITPGLFRSETLVPVPLGFSGKRFNVVMEGLLSDPARLRKYANGDMAGGNAEIDYDDVEFEAFTPDIFFMKKDGKYLTTPDGTKYAVNVRKALEDE